MCALTHGVQRGEAADVQGWGWSRRPGRQPHHGQGQLGAERGYGHAQIVNPGPRSRRQNHAPFFIRVASGAGNSETGHPGAARVHG